MAGCGSWQYARPAMRKGTVPRRPVETRPRVRRGYFECRYGQLHVHNAIPPGGGFEEGTPLLCIHRLPLSGWMFEGMLVSVGRDRSVYAPDLPGFGASDPPPSRPGVAELALALADFLDNMRFRQIDVLGERFGALVAADLALTRPKQVRRVVLASVPLLPDAERESRARGAAAPAGGEEGAQLLADWRRLREAYGARTPEPLALRAFAERLRNAPHLPWENAAVAQYPLRERLGSVQQPVLALRPRDELWEAGARIRELLPRARVTDLPAQGYGWLEREPDAAAEAVREFLRG